MRSRPAGGRGEPERYDVIRSRVGVHRVALAEQVLVFQEKDGVLAAERGAQKAHDVTGPRREHDDETRGVGEDRLARLRVPDRAAPEVATDRDPQHEGHAERAVGSPPRRCRFGADLLHRGPDVVEELDLDRRAQAADRLADAPPDDVRLGERGVVAAVVAEVPLQPAGEPEDAAEAGELLVGRVGDVLAEDAHPLVGRHDLVEGATDRLAEGDRLAGLARVGRHHERGELPEVLHHLRRIGFRRPQRVSAGRGGDGEGFLADGVRPLGVEGTALDELIAQPLHRVVGVGVGDLRRAAVPRLVVRGRVGVQPHDAGVDEDGTGPEARPADRLGAGVADREVVAAVELHDLEAGEAGDEVGDRCRGLVFDRDRDRETVVLDDVDDRQVQLAGGVEALPELALRGRPVAERDVGHLVGVGLDPLQAVGGDVPSGLRAADRRQALAARRARLGDDVERGVAPV